MIILYEALLSLLVKTKDCFQLSIKKKKDLSALFANIQNSPVFLFVIFNFFLTENVS